MKNQNFANSFQKNLKKFAKLKHFIPLYIR